MKSDHVPAASVAARLDRIRALVRLWDEAVRLPLVGKVGLDALFGLIPGFGDLLGAIVAFYPVIEATRLRVGAAVLGRMVLNIAIDAAVGAIPVLGDLLDIGWRANRRNLDLLERYLGAPTAVTRSSLVVLAGALALTFGMLGLVGWLAVLALRAVFR